jgi:hypothetical protein
VSGGVERILLQIILPSIQKFLHEEVNLRPISWCWGRIGLEEGRTALTIDDRKSLSIRYQAHRGLRLAEFNQGGGKSLPMELPCSPFFLPCHLVQSLQCDARSPSLFNVNGGQCHERHIIGSQPVLLRRSPLHGRRC